MSFLLGPSGVTREATTEMANNPKKMLDPTESALSAIQEALNLRESDTMPERSLASCRPLWNLLSKTRNSALISGVI